MKIILIIVLICMIMLIAKAVSEQIKDKYDFYVNLLNFLNQFKLNLAFKQEKVLDFLNSVKARKYFQIFIEEYKDYLKSGNLNLDKIKILDDNEKSELSNIVNAIGKYDANTEINQLETFIFQIEEKNKNAQSDKNKLCPMIIKLSILFAIGLAIILV